MIEKIAFRKESSLNICSYRTREEIQDVRKSRDPITSFRDKLIQANLATEEEFKVCSMNISPVSLDLFLSRISITKSRRLSKMQKITLKMIPNYMSMSSIQMSIPILQPTSKFVAVIITHSKTLANKNFLFFL